MRKSYVLKLAMLSAAGAFLFSGCSPKTYLTPKNPKYKAPPQEFEKYKVVVNIGKGGSLFSILKKIENASKGKIIIINKLSEDIIFDREMRRVSLEDIRNYIRIRYGKNIIFRKFGDRIVTVEEEDKYKHVKKTERLSKSSYRDLNAIPIHLKGEFTYEEIFNMLRKMGFSVVYEFFDEKSGEKWDESKSIKDFDGTLQSLLDFISHREKLFLWINGKTIKVSDKRTKIYDLNIPNLSISASSISAGDGSGSSVSATAKTETKQLTDPIEDLKEQLTSILGDKIKYSISKSNGTVSIMGDYQSLIIADQIIDNFKKIYSKTLKINVTIYQVALDREHAFGIDYNFIKNEIIGNKIAQAFSLSPGITNGLIISGGTLSYTATSGSLSENQQNNNQNQQNNNGQQQPQTQTTNTQPERINSFIFKFLNKFGKASIVTKPILTTINTVPIQLNIIDQKDYVYRINQNTNVLSNVNNAVSTSAINPEIKTLTTGFSIIVQPKIIDRDYIKMVLKMNTSTNNGFKVYEYGTDKQKFQIQLKDISSRSFENILKIRENETAIIGGYIYEKKDFQKNALPFVGMEDSAIDPLVSGKERRGQKMEIVLVITAKII